MWCDVVWCDGDECERSNSKRIKPGTFLEIPTGFTKLLKYTHAAYRIPTIILINTLVHAIKILKMDGVQQFSFFFFPFKNGVSNEAH